MEVSGIFNPVGSFRMLWRDFLLYIVISTEMRCSKIIIFKCYHLSLGIGVGELKMVVSILSNRNQFGLGFSLKLRLYR
jgi:hypothetical protein